MMATSRVGNGNRKAPPKPLEFMASRPRMDWRRRACFFDPLPHPVVRSTTSGKQTPGSNPTCSVVAHDSNTELRCRKADKSSHHFRKRLACCLNSHRQHQPPDMFLLKKNKKNSRDVFEEKTLNWLQRFPPHMVVSLSHVCVVQAAKKVGSVVIVRPKILSPARTAVLDRPPTDAISLFAPPAAPSIYSCSRLAHVKFDILCRNSARHKFATGKISKGIINTFCSVHLVASRTRRTRCPLYRRASGYWAFSSFLVLNCSSELMGTRGPTSRPGRACKQRGSQGIPPSSE
jgi:hypothetical protein